MLCALISQNLYQVTRSEGAGLNDSHKNAFTGYQRIPHQAANLRGRLFLLADLANGAYRPNLDDELSYVYGLTAWVAETYNRCWPLLRATHLTIWRG